MTEPVNSSDPLIHGRNARAWAQAGQKALARQFNESLERRYEASDKSWIEGWLQDEVDPCESESE